MGSSLTHVLEKPARGDACVHEHQHLWADLLEQAVRPMDFRDIVAAHLQSNDRMAATLGQEHTAHLWIGSWPVLITAATKGRGVGFRVGGVKDGAINGHEPIATKEGDFSLLDRLAIT
jgi:hypothetical protein